MVYQKFKKVKLNIIRGRKLLPFPTAKVIQDHEDRLNEMTGADTSFAKIIGEIDVDNDGDIATQLANKADTSALNNKANANHSHTLNKITDLDTIEAVITYTDESTETVLLVKQVVSNEP